ADGICVNRKPGETASARLPRRWRRLPSRATMIRLSTAALLALFLLTAASAYAEAPAGGELFDPARHMHVSEVKPGMKGYGLSVFKGTKIERFDVEVMSVLRDFNPQYDVVLVRLKGADLEHTGSIAGMSGSPIYLMDDQGRERMIGAFAYGWPLMKDPVGGVQPIEYMLRLHQHPPATRPAVATEAHASAASKSPVHWDLSDPVMLPGMTHPPASWP